MSKPVNRVAHRDFCETEGWDVVRRATGASVSHHLTFRFQHPDGRMLRTRISRPVKGEPPYGSRMAAHILRDQLEVTAAVFWACVDDGVRPQRTPMPQHQEEPIPLAIIRLLRTEVGLPEAELRALTRDEALRRAAAHWSKSADS